VLAKIVKARIADLNLHFPEFPFDCRISINLEMDWDGEVADLERMQANKSQASHRPAPPNRNKDRLSYSHGQYQIDLTQVTQVIHGPNVSQFHCWSMSRLTRTELPAPRKRTRA